MNRSLSLEMLQSFLSRNDFMKIIQEVPDCSLKVIIATKRGKPGFVPPGEVAPEIDDDDAKADERKKKVSL